MISVPYWWGPISTKHVSMVWKKTFLNHYDSLLYTLYYIVVCPNYVLKIFYPFYYFTGLANSPPQFLNGIQKTLVVDEDKPIGNISRCNNFHHHIVLNSLIHSLSLSFNSMFNLVDYLWRKNYCNCSLINNSSFLLIASLPEDTSYF